MKSLGEGVINCITEAQPVFQTSAEAAALRDHIYDLPRFETI